MMLTTNVSAGYSYRHEESEHLYYDDYQVKVATLYIDDSYYEDTRCLTIHDTVDYDDEEALKPYNFSLVVEYSFYYTDYTTGGLRIPKTANRDGYQLTYGVQSDASKMCCKVKVDHYLNCYNMVADYSTIHLETEFPRD
jgi:hypothetical protein